VLDYLSALHVDNIVCKVFKQSLDLQTSNFKFKFVFVFQPFDIRIQASLIRCRWFCLESGVLLLQWCTVWWFLCSLSVTVPLFTFPSLHTAAVFNYSLSCTVPLACCILMQAIKVTDLGGPDTEQTSVDCNRARHGLTSWLITLLIDCFSACGVRAVTFISPHSADIKRKLLKLLRKYILEIWGKAQRESTRRPKSDWGKLGGK